MRGRNILRPMGWKCFTPTVSAARWLSFIALRGVQSLGEFMYIAPCHSAPGNDGNLLEALEAKPVVARPNTRDSTSELHYSLSLTSIGAITPCSAKTLLAKCQVARDNLSLFAYPRPAKHRHSENCGLTGWQSGDAAVCTAGTDWFDSSSRLHQVRVGIHCAERAVHDRLNEHEQRVSAPIATPISQDPARPFRARGC